VLPALGPVQKTTFAVVSRCSPTRTRRPPLRDHRARAVTASSCSGRARSAPMKSCRRRGALAGCARRRAQQDCRELARLANDGFASLTGSSAHRHYETLAYFANPAAPPLKKTVHALQGHTAMNAPASGRQSVLCARWSASCGRSSRRAFGRAPRAGGPLRVIYLSPAPWRWS
jgi:hypothetical protein